MLQTATCDDLYKKIAELHGNSRPLSVKDPSGDFLPEGKATLKETLFDGAKLDAEYRQKWTLIILNQGGRSTLTVEVSVVRKPICFYNCVYRYALMPLAENVRKQNKWWICVSRIFPCPSLNIIPRHYKLATYYRLYLIS